MLSEFQQKRVWEGMLGAEIRSNYFAELAGRYARIQKFATWGTLFLSSGAAVAILANLPAGLEWVRFTLAAFAAGLSLFSVVAQNQKLAIDASDLHTRWNKLAKEYRRLWENVYADGAVVQLEALEDRATDLSKAAAILPNDRRAMLRWQDYVERQHGLAHVG